MKTKRLFGGLLAVLMVTIMAFVAAPAANARVSGSMNGTYYKNVGQYGGEYVSISYNPNTGRATVIYAESYNWGNEQYFTLSGRASGGYLVVSGRGYAHGRNTTMKVRITQVDQHTIKVVVGSGRAYYFYR
ncbi:MAG: hypothetical protein IJP59_10235 [Muribaculaceae bacterium]|nr:hypothetical protein [Muribaculaceae bacterium]